MSRDRVVEKVAFEKLLVIGVWQARATKEAIRLIDPKRASIKTAAPFAGINPARSSKRMGEFCGSRPDDFS